MCILFCSVSCILSEIGLTAASSVVPFKQVHFISWLLIPFLINVRCIYDLGEVVNGKAYLSQGNHTWSFSNTMTPCAFKLGEYVLVMTEDITWPNVTFCVGSHQRPNSTSPLWRRANTSGEWFRSFSGRLNPFRLHIYLTAGRNNVYLRLPGLNFSVQS